MVCCANGDKHVAAGTRCRHLRSCSQGYPAGFAVVQAGSLTEVRRLLEGVGIAILGLSLPDGNGAVLVPELHAANPHATAVVLTSSIDSGEGAQALQRGAAAVLNKLDHLDQLLATVKRLQRRPTI
jgi:DNA-binding NarL/FixJ family response regulator